MVLRKVNCADAYALSLLGLIPKQMRTEMYDKYFGRIDISPNTKEIIETKINREESTC